MTRLLLLLALVIVAARFFWRLVEVVVRSASSGAAPGARRGGPPASVKMAPCAVCGTFVVPGKATSVVSGGEPVYFCSDTCRAAFHPR